MSAAPPITVLLVDDHAVVRQGYRRLLARDPAVQVVAEAASARRRWTASAAASRT